MRFFRFLFSRLFICLLVIAAIFTAIIFLCLYLHSLLPAALGAVAAYALSLTSALFLFCRDGRNDYKCAWLAVIAALPVVGAIAYAFSCTGMDRNGETAVPPPAATYTDCGYFKDGDYYLHSLIKHIQAAEHTVYLEYYIISKGQIWTSLCKEIENALARGVSVKIIYDAFGSILHAPKRDCRRLSKLGAQIKIFNKLRPFPVFRLNSRNHRKIAVIDSFTVFLGGVNVADEYANVISPYGYWKDGGVRLNGGIAKEYERIFLSDFYGEKHLPEKIHESQKDGQDAKTVLAVADSPEFINGCCEQLITAKIYSATQRVCIFTPYLCVGEQLKDALLYAAGRGVSVEIIIPEIPDKRITFEISLTFAAELKEKGVKIYRYTPGFMHAKCVICDDEVLLGSYNFDYRSMRLNYECGIWASGKLAELVYADFKESTIASSELSGKKACLPRRAVRGALKLFAPLV